MVTLIQATDGAPFAMRVNPAAPDNPSILITVPERLCYYAIAWMNPATQEFGVVALWYQYWGFTKKYTFYQPKILDAEKIVINVVKV